MEISILSPSFKRMYPIDMFNSLIWTDRYSAYGDFQIVTSINSDILSRFVLDYYLEMKDSEHVMIVEDRIINSDAEDGNYFTIRGRSLESILERRVIANQTILSGSLQEGVRQLLNENAISPIDSARIIPNLIFAYSTDVRITNLTVEAQFTGVTLYEAVKKLCDAANLGFKITVNELGQMVFMLYRGDDRSYDQITNPYVVFAPSFDNINQSNYLESKKILKTVTLVAGEGEGSDRKTLWVETDNVGTGLARRELFTDARDISSTTNEGELTEVEYQEQLWQRGMEDLAENSIVQAFEGQVETDQMFVYGVDFFMGDIVQLANEYGIESKSRVTELVQAQQGDGINSYPTFITVE